MGHLCGEFILNYIYIYIHLIHIYIYMYWIIILSIYIYICIIYVYFTVYIYICMHMMMMCTFFLPRYTSRMLHGKAGWCSEWMLLNIPYIGAYPYQIFIIQNWDVAWTKIKCLSGLWYTYPSEKYEFVSWDHDSPNWMESHKIQDPNHQPAIISPLNHH